MAMIKNTSYLLAIDIGNTTTVVGFYQHGELLDYFRLASKHTLTSDEAGVLITSLRRHQLRSTEEVNGVAICSVVPYLTAVYQEMAQRYCGQTALVVTHEVKLKTRLVVDYPHQVGADRIANAEGYVHKYTGPGIIVDFGTATTFDVISGSGEYLGGVIAPGIETSSARLSERAAKLFKIKLEAPRQAIGRNTEDALKSGLLYGAIGQVEGIVRRIKDQLGGNPRVIATGGLARTIAAETEIIQDVDDTLTLDGVAKIYENNMAQ